MAHSPQSAPAVLMIRPAHFGFNPETASSNAFQEKDAATEDLRAPAQQEFDQMVADLRSAGIKVVVIEDRENPACPDAIFPNNWISFHEDGRVVLYPMEAPNRRKERRTDILSNLTEHGFTASEVVDLSQHENDNRFLEGTGSIIFDYQHRRAYACISTRTDAALFERTSQQLGFPPFSFRATDLNGQAVYHTNVVLTVGSGYVVICLDAIENSLERALLKQQWEKDGLEIVNISHVQMNAFAGNMLEVRGAADQPVLVLSETAMRKLTSAQKDQLQAYVRLLPIAIPTIEKAGGGSVRCMMAGIHLPVSNS